MVAFRSCRRGLGAAPGPKQTTAEALAAAAGNDPLRSAFAAGASRRSASGVEVSRDPRGEINQVRIGRWRRLAASPQRRLAEVRQLPGQRVAVRIERYAEMPGRPSSEIWQLYNLEGRLDAALQSTPDGKFALLTNYQTRQVSRLVQNERNDLETVERWTI